MRLGRGRHDTCQKSVAHRLALMVLGGVQLGGGCLCTIGHERDSFEATVERKIRGRVHDSRENAALRHDNVQMPDGEGRTGKQAPALIT